MGYVDKTYNKMMIQPLLGLNRSCYVCGELVTDNDYCEYGLLVGAPNQIIEGAPVKYTFHRECAPKLVTHMQIRSVLVMKGQAAA